MVFSALECFRFNADYDGDEMNVLPLRFWHVAVEAFALASSARRAITRRDGSPALSWALDSMVGFYLASKRRARVRSEHVAGLLRRASASVVAAAALVLRARGPASCTGRALLSACVCAHLGEDYHYSYRGQAVVVAGHVVAEMTMLQLARTTEGLLVHAIRARGHQRALAFLEDSDKMCCDFARDFGASLHMADYSVHLLAGAVIKELDAALADVRTARVWAGGPSSFDAGRAAMLAIALRQLLLFPFRVPERLWPAVAEAASFDDASAAAIFAAAGVPAHARTPGPVDLDQAMAYGTCMLTALLAAEGGSERGAGEVRGGGLLSSL